VGGRVAAAKKEFLNLIRQLATMPALIRCFMLAALSPFIPRTGGDSKNPVL